MTPQQFRAIRHGWGLSQRDMAALVGTRTGRTVRKWESGEREIPDSAKLLVSFYLRFPPLRTLIDQVRDEMEIPPVSDAHVPENVDA